MEGTTSFVIKVFPTSPPSKSSRKPGTLIMGTIKKEQKYFEFLVHDASLNRTLTN